MARTAKKETVLTPEEKLVQALVAEAEQPYQVPENWCWTNLGSYIDYATDYVANGSFATLKENVNIYKEENYALMVKTADFANDFTKSLTFTDKHGYEFLSKSVLYGGELILSNIGSIGKVFRVPFFNRPMTLASNSVMIKCFHELDYDWLYYFFLSPIGFEELMAITTGTAVLKFNKTDLKTIPFPVPPLAEQHRIVDRIESLFAKLDEAKEKAQTVVDGYEDRKAAILHKAFTGELTKQWRESQGLSFSSWDALSFGELTKDVRLGLVRGKVEQATDKQYGYLKMNNITMDGFVDLDGLVRVDATVDEVSIYSLCPGDFLFNTRNSFELVGKNAVWQLSEVKDMLFNNNIMRVRFHDEVLPQFVCYYFNSAEGKRDLEKVKKNTTNIAAIYAKDLNKIRIPLPSKEEQEQICLIISSIIDSLLAAREAAEQVIDQIDTMKKAILARAFRGELGTNDPDDESAEELLKRVL